MASTPQFASFVADQVSHLGRVRTRRMFGEFFVYIDDRPVLLICDETVFVRPLAELGAILAGAEMAPPFEGAKRWYILDIDDRDLVEEVVAVSLPLVPVPKKKNNKKKATQAKPARAAAPLEPDDLPEEPPAGC
ncbi:transcriptional regulator [Corynebacterium sp. 13CS0277]|uniref:TfoX/Sxy family protein n=1 Tax=Corynebacterium sp. 13CS0277 TaxID=2071994 RepID=UPI000D03A710|nr:TfoX/Sxy family protein [Corynebacterium sp. 13CS0277]PRQ10359.1 transcriptional regulator [Corynebacterium sp. 13CS0277]